MSDLTAWYLNQLDTHGLPAVLAAQFVICLAVALLIGGAWSAAQRREEQQPIDNEQPARKETPQP
ncbi:hypothetical protein F7R91_14430 [Streptomyces luteolifulvus]|uniref:Uncharacterized protein n=1 Tax=Streptomyces luteolifulvus TaxID=2615112 RepID=A0A6H9V2B9_9ACTN|nr:hypothetical protein [Streptomyces luteolifulvus]KAB1146773.1 hypothetical protein F7R91_14430 [Streptomyces luteolifulvus]